MPLENVARLPPVKKLYPSWPVSPICTRILSIPTFSSSAAIMHNEARKPPMSGVPAVRESVPSSFSDSVTAVSPPMLNQKPLATPRP